MKSAYSSVELSEILGISARSIRMRAEKEIWTFAEIPNINGGGTVKLFDVGSMSGQMVKFIELKLMERDANSNGIDVDGCGAIHSANQCVQISGNLKRSENVLDDTPESDQDAEDQTQGAEDWSRVPEREKQIALARMEVLRCAEAYCLSSRNGKARRVQLLQGYYGQVNTAIRSRDSGLLQRLGFDPDRISSIFSEVKKVSISIDYRWRAAYEDARRKYGLGVLGLVRSYKDGPGIGARTITADMIAWVRTLIRKGQVKLMPVSKYRGQGALVTVNRKVLYRRMQAKYQDSMPSYAHFTRWINQYLQQEQEGLAAVVLPGFWRSTFAPKGGSASEKIEYAGQFWEMDGTTADIMCKDGRHEFIAAIDVFTRDVVYCLDKHASSITVARTMFAGITRWGVPEGIGSDRGTIFISEHIKSACEAMDIKLKPCLAYAPNQKPHIESFNNTIAKMLFESIPWYIGHSPNQRKRIEEYDKFQQVFFHERGAKVSCDLTSEELNRTIQDWLEKIYRVEQHQFADASRHGRAKTVFERRAASFRRAKEVKNLEVLDLLLAPRIDRVFASGVSWLGDAYLPVDVASWERVQPYAQQVVIFRPGLSDAGKGGIWQRIEDGNGGRIGDFICRVNCRARGGMDLDEFAKSRRSIEKGHKARRKAVDELFAPPTYADELREMPMPKVAVANFGAEEFSGRAYDTARPSGEGGDDGKVVPILKAVSRVGEEVRRTKKDAERGDGGRDPRGRVDDDDSKASRELQEELARKRSEMAVMEASEEQSVDDWRDELRLQEAEPSIWDRLSGLASVDQYEELLELEARGVAIPSEYQHSMRVFEHSDAYRGLADYFEKRRAMFAATAGRGDSHD